MLIGRSESTAIDDAVGELEPKGCAVQRRRSEARRRPNGYLDFRSSRASARGRAGGRALWDKASAKRLFDKSDLNKDGRLDFNEYVIEAAIGEHGRAPPHADDRDARRDGGGGGAAAPTRRSPSLFKRRVWRGATRWWPRSAPPPPSARRSASRRTMLGSLTDDEVEVLIELCGGAAASVEPHAADAQFSLLEMRVGPRSTRPRSVR